MKKRHVPRPSASLIVVISLIVLLLGLCLLADGLETVNGWRRDHSFNAVTTQSETTLQVLSELLHPVQIYAAYARGSEDGPLLELLNRYASASDLVTWKQVDLSLNPAFIRKYRNAATSESVTSDSVIVACEETGRFRILDATDFYTLGYNMEAGAYEIAGLSYEASLTSAIRYVALDEVPRAMFLPGGPYPMRSEDSGRMQQSLHILHHSFCTWTNPIKTAGGHPSGSCTSYKSRISRVGHYGHSSDQLWP